jgi:hypothetical protein
MLGIRRVLTVTGACSVLALLSASPVLATTTTIDFEGSTPTDGSVVTNQYASDGLEFLSDNSRVPPGYTAANAPAFSPPAVVEMSSQGGGDTAHSGSRAIELDPAEDEFPAPALEGSFDMTTRSTVSLWVRAGDGVSGSTGLTLTAYDYSGAPITGAADTESVPADGGWHEFTVTEPGGNADIQYFTLAPTSPGVSFAQHFYVDDISFDVPSAGQITPHFVLRYTGLLPVDLPQDQSATATVSIHRVNGSNGPLTLDYGALPSGVTAQIQPNPAQNSDTSATITFHADQNAPPTSSPAQITISASGGGGVGTGGSATIPLNVQRVCGDPSFSIVHVAPLDGGCFHPNGDGSYTYQGDALKLNGITIGNPSGFTVDPTHRLIDATFITIAAAGNIPGGGTIDLPLYAGPILVTIPNGAAGGTPGPVALVALSTGALGHILAPFQIGGDHGICGQDGSSNGSGASDPDAPENEGSGSGSDDNKCDLGSLTDDINLTGTGADAPIEIKLPAGLTADVDFKWKTATGLVGDTGYKFSIAKIPLGPINIGPITFAHSGPGQWSGTGGFSMPSPANFGVNATVGFDNSPIPSQLNVNVTGLHIPFVSGSFLTSLQAGYQIFHTPPWIAGLNGGLGVQWGPQVNGHALAEIDGTVSFDWGDLNTPRPASEGGPPYWPFDLTVGAHVKIAGIDIGNGTVTIAQDDQGFTFRLEAQVGVAYPTTDSHGNPVDPDDALIAINGSLLGWVQPPNFEAQASVALKVVGIDVAGADLLVSSDGWAACGHIGPFAGGFGQHWGHSVDVMGPFGCDISGYAPAYRSQGPGGAVDASTSHTLVYPKGSKPVYLKLYSRTGNPKVTLSGPGGRRLTMPATGHAPSANNQFLVLQYPPSHMTVVAINNPAGRWTLAPEAGSPPIVKTLGATTLPSPKVSAKITGSGGRRTLRYRIAPQPHQVVQFAEIGARTHRLIGTARGRSGKITFTPDPTDVARARTIEAIVNLNGIPETQFTVARFKAPRPPKPRDPSRITVAHASGGVVISWVPGTQASGYRVMLLLADGVNRYTQVSAKKRQVLFQGVPKSLKAKATVQEQTISGGLGKVVKSGAKPPKKHKHKHKKGGKAGGKASEG